jgi:hypothetical protein
MGEFAEIDQPSQLSGEQLLVGFVTRWRGKEIE